MVCCVHEADDCRESMWCYIPFQKTFLLLQSTFAYALIFTLGVAISTGQSALNATSATLTNLVTMRVELGIVVLLYLL